MSLNQYHYIAVYVNAENVTYFDVFGVKHIPEKLDNSLEIKVLQRIFIEYRHMI